MLGSQHVCGIEGDLPGLLGSYHSCHTVVRGDVGSFTPCLPGQGHGQGSAVIREAEEETPMGEAGKGVRNESQRWVQGCRDRAGEYGLELKLGEQSWGAEQGGRRKSRE